MLYKIQQAALRFGYREAADFHDFVLMAAITALSGVDALFTLLLVMSAGLQVEANPLMRAAIAAGPGTFVALKMAITWLGLILVGMGSARGFSRTRGLLAGILTGYLMLLGYHIYIARGAI
jgi:hypothetical protein